MEDIKDIAQTINASGATTPGLGIQYIYKVTRNGIGLRIVEPATGTENKSISSFQWRFINPLSTTHSGQVYKFNSVLSFVEYRTGITFLGTPLEGETYVIDFLGIVLNYVVQAGDTNTSIRDAIKVLVDATSYAYPTTTSTATLTGNPTLYIDALTGFVPPCTVAVRGTGYYLSKSGLFVDIGGYTYLILVNEAAGYSVPAIPALDPNYDFSLMTLVTDLYTYLFNPSYPIDDEYGTAVEGTADVDNIESVPTLGPNDVYLNKLLDVFEYGTAFSLGYPELVQYIYK